MTKIDIGDGEILIVAFDINERERELLVGRNRHWPWRDGDQELRIANNKARKPKPPRTVDDDG